MKLKESIHKADKLACGGNKLFHIYGNIMDAI